MNRSFSKKYGTFSSWLLIIYLGIMVSGCAYRPAELPPAEARAIQTRELNNSVEEVARAAVMVLQEMHFTLGEVDMGLGVITADRHSERSIAPMSKTAEDEVPDEVQTFCLVAGGLAIAALLFAWLWDDDERDDDWGPTHRGPRIHHHPGPVYIGDDHDSDSYHYKMTITLEELGSYKSRMRVSVQGQYYDGGSVSSSGPIQDEDFYADFYNRLQIALKQ